MDFDGYDHLDKDNRPIYRKRDENDNEDDDRRRKISRRGDDDRENDRRRYRDRERSNERRWREKSKERESGWSKERERDREREGSRSRRYGSGGSESEKEKEREATRSRRFDNRERGRGNGDELRGAEIRDRRLNIKKEAVEAEADPERDQRTVYAYQLPLKAMERDVHQFFSKAGKVKDIRLSMDRNSKRSKGVGYIEFYDVMSVSKALAMSGQVLLGQPVMIKPSGAEKNPVQSTASNGSSVTDPLGPTDRKLYVGNLHYSMTEQQLRQIFVAFGPIELVELPLDPETGNCKGFGFVQFTQAEHAKNAQSLNGNLEIAGRRIKVSSVTENLGAQEAGTTAADFDDKIDNDGGDLALSVTDPLGPTDRKLYVGNLHYSMTEQQLRQIFVAFGPIELVELPLDPETGNCKGFGFVQFTQAEHAKNAQSLHGNLEIVGRRIKVSSVTENLGAQEAGTTAADFDDKIDNDGGDLALNASTGATLMAVVPFSDPTGTALSIAESTDVPFNGSTPVQQPLALPENGQAAPNIPGHSLSPVVSEPVGLPSECLLLKNLFDPVTENDPEFDLDIKEDVKEECSKFGRVRHIYVDKHSAGHVYLRYHNKEDAKKAQRGLHMRWFGRRSAFANFMQPRDYESTFPDGT